MLLLCLSISIANDFFHLFSNQFHRYVLLLLLNEGRKEEAINLLTLIDLEIQIEAISIEEMLLNNTTCILR